MTIPRILWESVAISSVTSARVSEDYIAVEVKTSPCEFIAGLDFLGACKLVRTNRV